MRVFVTGATGFIGTVVVAELVKNGHTVLGLVRSDSSAAKLKTLGGESLKGSIEDLDILKQGATSCDAIIHLAFIHDFNNYAAACETDLKAVTAMGEAIKGTKKPFINTTGTLGALVPGRAGTEDDLVNPNAGNPRALSEVKTGKLAEEGINAQIVRLAPSVHGTGDRAFVPKFIVTSKEKGESAYIGDGQNVWPAVHRLDAAVVYRLAIEKGTPGAIWHAVGDDGIPIKQIAEVIGKKFGIPVVSKTAEEMGAWIGFLAWPLSLNNPCTSKKTKEKLGWKPAQVGLLEDMEKGAYFDKENLFSGL